MRPLSISSRTPIPVIPYVSNGVGQTLILHTQANNYRCKNEGCPCHAEAERRAMEGDTGKMATMEREREWGSPPRVTHVDRSTGDELHDRIRALRLPDYPQVRIHTYILGTFSTETRIVVYLADRPIDG